MSNEPQRRVTKSYSNTLRRASTMRVRYKRTASRTPDSGNKLSGNLPQLSEQPDTSAPSPERQAELEAAYERQKDTETPYKDIAIRTLGELQWIMQQRQWSSEVYLPAGIQRANLSRANLGETNLSGAILDRANLSNAWLSKANLSGASFFEANLSSADIQFANLNGANLIWANLSKAVFRAANLSNANLNGANLSRATFNGADLQEANLSGADLSGASLTMSNLSGTHFIHSKLDSDTVFGSAKFSSTTKLRDIRWNGVDLTRVNWESLLTSVMTPTSMPPPRIKPEPTGNWLPDCENKALTKRTASPIVRGCGNDERPATRVFVAYPHISVLSFSILSPATVTGQGAPYSAIYSLSAHLPRHISLSWPQPPGSISRLSPHW